MAAGFTSYSVDNDKKFRSALREAAKQSDDLRLPFTLIAADFYRSQRAIFQLSGPGQYPDLSPEYKKRKQQRFGRIYPILKAHGYLEAAASVQRGPGNITEVGRQELTLGVDDSSVPYAKYHQSDKPRAKMPLRKYLFIGPESSFATNEQKGRLERWMNILSGYINETLNNGVGG